jgi:DNA-binding response OmpR family regulator
MASLALDRTRVLDERVQVVLVADDDPDILQLVALALKRDGYAILCASDGEEALRLAREHRPDLAVLDVTMPKLSGYDVTERLRASAEMVKTPVMLLTGHVQDADIARGFESGADDYLEKPFSPQELRSRVQLILDGSSPM